MFRMWGKLWKDNHLTADTVACLSDASLTRTQLVLKALEEICCTLDLGNPIWLDANILDFQLHSKTRFNQDNFIESISFDYLEIHIIEE